MLWAFGGWARLPCSTGRRNYISNCTEEHLRAREPIWRGLLGGGMAAGLGSAARQVCACGSAGGWWEAPGKAAQILFWLWKTGSTALLVPLLQGRPSSKRGCPRMWQSRLCLSFSSPLFLGVSGDSVGCCTQASAACRSLNVWLCWAFILCFLPEVLLRKRALWRSYV